MKTIKTNIRKIALGFFLLTAVTANAQEIGLRYGNNQNGNLAIDGVFAFKNSRIHADLSFTNSLLGNGLGAAVLYDFSYRALKNEYWSFYSGLGVAANYSGSNEILGGSLDLGGAFELGTEYKFDGAPIVIGIDWRPTIMIIGSKSLELGRWGLNARYVFTN